MLCQNCGKNEVNFRYTQIINGVKKEMALCDKCAKSLGIEGLDFNMPINFSSFLGDFLGEIGETNFLPTFTKTKTLQCNHCNMTYEEFINSGKFGCSNCYDVFSNGLDKVLKNIHGSDTHIGRRSSRLRSIEKTEQEKNAITNNHNSNIEKQQNKVANSKEEKTKQLNMKLKQAIKEERYEDAAKIRDEIKKMSL